MVSLATVKFVFVYLTTYSVTAHLVIVNSKFLLFQIYQDCRTCRTNIIQHNMYKAGSRFQRGIAHRAHAGTTVGLDSDVTLASSSGGMRYLHTYIHIFIHLTLTYTHTKNYLTKYTALKICSIVLTKLRIDLELKLPVFDREN